MSTSTFICFFFFNDTATTEIYTLSLHDALPISSITTAPGLIMSPVTNCGFPIATIRMSASRVTDFMSRVRECTTVTVALRSEEHTSELQSRSDLVCRLLLEKKTDHSV